MSNQDTTIVQRVLASTSLALESTMLRLRRLHEQDVPKTSREELPDATPQGPAGKVEHDSRGSAVWNWAIETGCQALENTQRLLKRLEQPELSIDEKPAARAIERDSGGGYDPYNQSKARPRRR